MMKTIKKHIASKIHLCLSLILLLFGSGCKKLVEVDLPADRITGEAVYSNIGTTVAVMNGIYSTLGNTYLFNINYSYPYIGDEILVNSSSNFPSYRNDYLTGSVDFVWTSAYLNIIYPCNSLIEGVQNSKGIDESRKKMLIAEAKFTRALVYFYLANSFGDVPLVLTTNLKANSNIERSDVTLVYDQIIKDLTQCLADLSKEYLNSDLETITSDRVRPTKAAATALLARVYLFKKDWFNAEIKATELIENSKFRLNDLGDVFLKNSSETIWALQPNLADQGMNVNTPEGSAFIPYFTIGQPGLSASEFLLEAFENDDERKSNWLKQQDGGNGQIFYYPFKYKVGSSLASGITDSKEYSIVFRLAEQYLIRAEARAELGKLGDVGGAREDLDIIRNRAGLLESNATTKDDLLKAIYHERQIELFTEGGLRWLDLKRTNTINTVMEVATHVKGGTWEAYKALFPIPYNEFLTNPALKGHQNPGYPETR